MQRVKEETNNSKYHLRLGETAACTKRTTEATNGVGQRDIKGATKDCFLFDSWFSSKTFAEDAMDVGADMVFITKPIHKGSSRRPLISLQSTSQEVITSCWVSSLWYPGSGR